MLKIEFTIDDLNERSRRYYHTCSMSWDNCSDDCIDDMLGHFEDFLIGMGYSIKPGELQFVREDECTKED